MATTSPDNIWTPDAGDDYALTTDLATMADTIQDAITTLRGLSNVGLEADLPSTADNGSTYYATDTDKTYLRVGGVWIIERVGLRTWSPTVSGLTVGNGTLSCRYQRTGRVVDFFIDFAAGSTSSVSGPIFFTFPEAPLGPTTYRHFGEGLIRLAGGSAWVLQPRMAGSSTFSLASLNPSGSAVAPGSNLSETFPTSGSWGDVTYRPTFYAHGTYLTAA